MFSTSPFNFERGATDDGKRDGEEERSSDLASLHHPGRVGLLPHVHLLHHEQRFPLSHPGASCASECE